MATGGINGAATVTGCAALLLNVKALLLRVPAPLIAPEDTPTVPTESELLIKRVPPFILSVLEVGTVFTDPISRVPAVTVVDPENELAPDRVVVPVPFCTKAVDPAFGVPSGALTLICAPPVLLKLKLALDKVPVPVIDPLDTVTVPTALLLLISKEPPLRLIATPPGSVLAAPNAKVP